VKNVKTTSYIPQPKLVTSFGNLTADSKKLVGAIDDVTYVGINDNWPIALQFVNGEPDFYAPGVGDVSAMESMLAPVDHPKLEKVIAEQYVYNLDDVIERFKVGGKPVNMVNISDITDEDSITIQSPWHLSQTQTQTKDGYVVVAATEVYLVGNDNESPINYIKEVK
jgi:hypothetical protein